MVVRNGAIQEGEWTTERRASWDTTKETLNNVVWLVCLKSVWQTLTFRGVSDLYRGCFATQGSPEDFASGVAFEEIHREPLEVFSGQLKGVQLRWATVDKEAFAIVSACRRVVDAAGKGNIFRYEK